MNITRFDQLPLRQRKYARTKLGLLDALLAAIRTRSLESVRVKELCDAAMISEASFFNYFPKKSDVLVYYVQLWSLKMAWHTERIADEQGGLAAIEQIFALTAQELGENRQAMGEIIAYQATMTEAPRFVEITPAERLLAFPELEGIEAVQGQGLQDLVPPLLRKAVELGELPAGTDMDAAMLGVAAIFFGLPVVLRLGDPAEFGSIYRDQLRVFWKGLRASHQESDTTSRREASPC